jgi:hypothetical protein
VIVVRVEFDFGPDDFGDACLEGGVPGDSAADRGGVALWEDGADGGLNGEGAEAFATHDGGSVGGDEGAVFVAAGGDGDDELAAEGVVVMLVGTGERAELDDGSEVAGSVLYLGIVVLDVGREVDIDFRVGPGDEVEAFAVGVDVGGGAGGGVLVDEVESVELDHLRGGRDDGDGVGGLPGEGGANAVLPGGEEVSGGGGLGEGGGGEKCEKAEGESAANVQMHAGFLVAGFPGEAGRELFRYGAGEIEFELPRKCRECGGVAHRSPEGLGDRSMG